MRPRVQRPQLHIQLGHTHTVLYRHRPHMSTQPPCCTLSLRRCTVYVCVCMCAYVYVCMCVCVYVCICVRVHVCVCVCTWANLERGGQGAVVVLVLTVLLHQVPRDLLGLAVPTQLYKQRRCPTTNAPSPRSAPEVHAVRPVVQEVTMPLAWVGHWVW
jgi:hypothetical protein